MEKPDELFMGYLTKEDKPMPSREDAVEEACRALELTHRYACYAYVSRRVEVDDIADIEASSLEAAAAMAYDHFWNEYVRDDNDEGEFPNVSVYVNNTHEVRHEDREFREYTIDARYPGESWAYEANRIVELLAKAETDEERQALVVKAREALRIDRTPVNITP